MTEVSISLNTLAAKQQSIVGIPKGNLNQLRDLVNFTSEGKVSMGALTVGLELFRTNLSKKSQRREKGRTTMRKQSESAWNYCISIYNSRNVKGLFVY